jgi:heterodisulfide reductase subunit A-like polyferredoxin
VGLFRTFVWTYFILLVLKSRLYASVDNLNALSFIMVLKKVHVGIVGAGISGLRCAEILLENGFQVTLLEARDRIGGRVSVIAEFKEGS